MSFDIVATPIAATKPTTNGFDDCETSSPPTTTYPQVSFGDIKGTLELSDESISFCPASASMPPVDGTGAPTGTTATIHWTSIVKHQISPASHPKAMLRLHTTDNGKTLVFQLPDREQLTKIRQDISARLRPTRSSTTANANANSNGNNNLTNNTNSNSAATVSGRKRSHNEIQDSSSSYKNIADSITELDPTALAVTRSALLAANPLLRDQHQFLVEESKTVSEDDFWKTHENLLHEQYARICGMTRAGTSSLLQSHLPLQGRVTLGVEEMRQIFILYQAVHKAYEEKVPLELSDEQFWRKYLESEYFHRDRGRMGTAARNHSSSNEKKNKAMRSAEEQEARAAAVGTDDLFSRYDQKLKEQPGAAAIVSTNIAAGKKWGTRFAVGQFDVESTYQTERGHLLEGPKDNHPLNAEDGGKGARVIQKYNRHWAMVSHPDEAVAGSNLLNVARRSVYDVLENDEDSKSNGGLDREMKRLVGFASAPEGDANHALGIRISDSDDYEPLNLENEEAYYSVQVQQAGLLKASEDQTKKYQSFFSNTIASKLQELCKETMRAREEANANKSAFLLDESCFPDVGLGQKLLAALTKKMAEDCKANTGSLEVVKTLPEDFKKRLHSYFLRSSELLRHFFRIWKQEAEGGSNRSNSDNLARIVTGMESFYREMETIRKNLPQNELGEVMRKMCLPIMDQLDWAFKLKAEGIGGRGGGGFVEVDE